MKRTFALLVMLAAIANPAQAVPGGPLRVLQRGYWVCETQGDAETAPVRQPQDSFTVIADSSYRTAKGEAGTYLLLGNAVTMTGGPFQGRRYTLVGQGMLHPLDAAGQRTTERCVRQGNAMGTDDSGN